MCLNQYAVQPASTVTVLSDSDRTNEALGFSRWLRCKIFFALFLWRMSTFNEQANNECKDSET
jgi:hypothetical protein